MIHVYAIIIIVLLIFIYKNTYVTANNLEIGFTRLLRKEK